jgi:hypothetical protein
VPLPDWSMSLLVMTWTGEAVSASVLRMFEPVISTRSSDCAGGVAWANAVVPALSRTPPQATISPVQSFVFFNMKLPPGESSDRTDL